VVGIGVEVGDTATEGVDEEETDVGADADDSTDTELLVASKVLDGYEGDLCGWGAVGGGKEWSACRNI